MFGEVAETAISRSRLPAAVTGTTIHITFGEMITVARALVPDLKHIAIVEICWTTCPPIATSRRKSRPPRAGWI